MSTDTDRIVNFGISFHMFWSLPFQIVVALVLLYLQVIKLHYQYGHTPMCVSINDTSTWIWTTLYSIQNVEKFCVMQLCGLLEIH